MKNYLILFCLLLSSLAEAHERDPVADQLRLYKESHAGNETLQTSWGTPVANIRRSLTAGPRGPIVITDTLFLDAMQNFGRERVPERAVHARGSGAFGYFKVTQDITEYSKAKVFSRVGKITRVAARFSLAVSERGAAETNRDFHGIAVKFYTEDGIWDLTTVDSPVFFIRDPIVIGSLTHAFARNPVTNIRDLDAIWDFFTSVPETVHRLLMYFSDDVHPDGYKHMSGFAQHPFKLVNSTGPAVFAKFHLVPDKGIKNLALEEAGRLTFTDPDYYTRDLYNSIANGDYPSWTMKIQVMTIEEAYSANWNVFDITKIWPEDKYPLKEVGQIVMNENPNNYFTDVEQIAFSPGHLVPGIEPGPDKILQARMFIYKDTQLHRLGPNNMQLPINCPFRHGVTNYQRDGPMAYYNKGGSPNYYPNTFNGPKEDPWGAWSTYPVTGEVDRYDDTDDDNYSHPANYWNSLTADHQDRMSKLLAAYLKSSTLELQERMFQMLSRVNTTLGETLRTLVNAER